MWIVLNPQKAHRFTTKGINLSKVNPVGYVKPDLEQEFQDYIKNAIINGTIIEVKKNTLGGMAIPKQASLDDITQENTSKHGTVQCIRDENKKVISHIITLPNEDGSVTKNTNPKHVILTDVTDSPLEDDKEN